MTVFYMRFLCLTDHKYVESSMFWQFFYYRPHSKFLYTAGEIIKMWCQELNIYLFIYLYLYIYRYIDITLSVIDMDFLYQFNLRLHHFSGFFFNVKKKCLVGEVVNHVGLFGSKAAEGCSVFQHWFWLKRWSQAPIGVHHTLQEWIPLTINFLRFWRFHGHNFWRHTEQ